MINRCKDIEQHTQKAKRAEGKKKVAVRLMADKYMLNLRSPGSV